MKELHLYLKILNLIEDISRYISSGLLTNYVKFEKNLVDIVLFVWLVQDISKKDLFGKGYKGYRVYLDSPLVIVKNNREIARFNIKPTIYDVINCIPFLRREYQEWKKSLK